MRYILVAIVAIGVYLLPARADAVTEDRTSSQTAPAPSTQPEEAYSMCAVPPGSFLTGALKQIRIVLTIIGLGTACGIGGILYRVLRPDGSKWPVIVFGTLGILAALIFGGLWWWIDGDYLLSSAIPYRVMVFFGFLPLLSGALALRLSVMRLVKRSITN